MNKKIIILTAAAGVVSFAATFGLSFLKNKKAVEAAQARLEEQKKAQQEQGERTLTEEDIRLNLTEKQLEELIYDVREKIREYNSKMKHLKDTEQRVAVAQSQLQKEIESLTELRTELASTVAALKQERNRLLNTRIEIKESERQNFANIAATYDRMKPEGAAKIFTNMSKMDTANAKGFNDVLKILYYMNDRTKAKVLAELVDKEPKLAANLSRQLKKIREVPQ